MIDEELRVSAACDAQLWCGNQGRRAQMMPERGVKHPSQIRSRNQRAYKVMKIYVECRIRRRQPDGPGEPPDLTEDSGGVPIPAGRRALPGGQYR